MSKIMLVEDDDNLREIYEARLLAEGYEIVSARDGEEALAIAVREKPDLIIADVMMPKISGFDMLDILRSTPTTKDVKVIMMTALSQAEDKDRAEKLGADRYLVKSQVTLEDVARVTGEVLQGNAPAATPAEPNTMAVADTSVAMAPITQSMPVATEPTPVIINTQPALASSETTTEQPAVAPPEPEHAPVNEPIKINVSSDTTAAEPTTIEPTQQPPAQDTAGYAPTVGGPDHIKSLGDDSPVSNKKIIQPIHDLSQKPDIHRLLDMEGPGDISVPSAPTDTVISPTGEISASPDSAVDPNSVAL